MQLIEEDYLRRITGFQRVCGLSEVDIEIFCDPERSHIKEGVILVDEENGAHFNIHSPRTVVLLLYGRQVKADELLKISQTALEAIIEKENSEEASGVGEDKNISKKRKKGGKVKPLKRKRVEEGGDTIKGQTNVADFLMQMKRGSVASGRASVSASDFSGSKKNRMQQQRFRLGEEGEGDTEEEMMFSPGGSSRLLTHNHLSDNAAAGLDASSGSLLESGEGEVEEEETDNVFLPYSNESQLDYLDDCFQTLALMIRVNAARLKDDMKKGILQ